MRQFKAADGTTVYEMNHGPLVIRAFRETQASWRPRAGAWRAVVGTLNHIGVLIPHPDADIWADQGTVTYNQRTRAAAIQTATEWCATR